ERLGYISYHAIKYFRTISSRTVTPKPGVLRIGKKPSCCTHGSETSSCCIGDSCGLKSMHKPCVELANKCALAAVLSALLQVWALHFKLAASINFTTLRGPVMPCARPGSI